jgi:hypothetical protein
MSECDGREGLPLAAAHQGRNQNSGLVRKWARAGEHLIEHHANRPNYQNRTYQHACNEVQKIKHTVSLVAVPSVCCGFKRLRRLISLQAHLSQ